ncbi:uncharacterized protein B0H64DRAFT_436791 [Chaetomium fimeti]|uniref:Uncharacterized protein n=1 Tax=Chaetomium fimeti TaxID=1854472 RepID=A0AAE0H5G7_9PEZI|nr:hypothetical protein B0H64DRAFT_436791 [Chaetomium fimeti]
MISGSEPESDNDFQTASPGSDSESDDDVETSEPLPTLSDIEDGVIYERDVDVQRADENGVLIPCENENTDVLDTNNPLVDESPIVSVVRFDTVVTKFCHFLVAWCRDIAWSQFQELDNDQPICVSAFIILFNSDPDILAQRVLAYVPSSVKAILRRANLSPHDLLPLLSAESHRDGGCYINIATGTTKVDPHPPPSASGASATRPRPRTLSVNNNNNNVDSKFVIIASMPLEGNRTICLLLEAVFQAYLNIVGDTTAVRQWHRPAVLLFIAKMRADTSIPLPDFSAYGLNAAWSLMQGGFSIPKAIRDQGCKVCGKKNKRMSRERARRWKSG